MEAPDSGTYMVIGGAIGGAATAVLGGVGALLAQRAKTRREDRADEFARMDAVTDRLEKQVGAQQIQLDRALVSEAKCREDMAKISTAYQFIYSVAQNLHAALCRAGIDVDPLPHMPDMKMTAAQEVTEFVLRTTQHNAQIVQQEAHEVKAKMGGGPARPAPPGRPNVSPPPGGPPDDDGGSTDDTAR